MSADTAPVEKARSGRRAAVRAFKRDAILQAARKIFGRDGLEAATLRAIAAEAGIAVGTVYLHYPSKEALYADMLAASLSDLLKAVREAVAKAPAEQQLMAGALAFYGFFHARPDDLYLGLYLGQGLRPVGLTPDLDRLLNGRLIQCFTALSEGIRHLAPLEMEALRAETINLVAGIVGAVVMQATGRLKILGDTGEDVVQRQVEMLAERLGRLRSPA